jgi:cytochrome c peroxidase
VPGFGDAEKRGLNVFTGKGDCASCHAGPLFTKAAVAVNGDQVMEFREMANGGVALTDTGFANIGTRPTRDDQGVGALDAFNGPLSFTREFVTSPAGTHPDPFRVNLGVLPGNFSSLTQRVAVDGAVKVPTLRNIAQTPPYFHNGGQGTLQQVVEFYNRGGDRRDVSGGDTSGTGPLGEDDALAIGPRGSNVDGKIKPRSFNAQDESDLVAFLRSLTDDRVRCHAAPFDHPELTVSHGADPSAKPNGVRAAESTVTLAAVGRSGIAPAKCAAVPNLGDVAQLPAVLNALKK